MDNNRIPSEIETPSVHSDERSSTGIRFPARIAEVLDVPPGASEEEVWAAFLDSFGELLLRVSAYGHSDRDASMDAYAFILEGLRKDSFRRLEAFPGGDEDGLTRWLAVVARRLCSDFHRHRYGRVRPATPEAKQKARRRLVDEIWDPKPSEELPAGRTSNPEWKLRLWERREALKTALAALEPRDRLLLVFRFENALPARRIAELMDFPTPFHVYRRLNRVLAGLKKHLNERGISDPDP